MSTIEIIHEIRKEHEAGVAYGSDPAARKHFERVVHIGEMNRDVRPFYYYHAHKRLADIYAFVRDEQKAEYYRKRLADIIERDE